ncbi:MAG: hypothetical protein H7X93_08585 [Sphingomonadaceae bacterium]|nr:hypothetical protein [Sphingomonadaceae bacterium]
MKARISGALVAAVLLAGCTPSNGESIAANEQGAATVEPVGDEQLGEHAEGAQLVTVEASAPGRPTYDPACAITEQSVAGVPLGPTLGDFAAAFPAGSRLVFRPNAMVDIGQLCLVTGGEPQICADFLSYGITEYAPDIELAQISAHGDQCRTAEGVGPGSTIEEAAAAYGRPNFSFNYDNEGREYVSFANAPQPYAFRARSEQTLAMQEEGGTWPNGEFAGDYRGIASDQNGFFETTIAYPESALWELTVTRRIPVE